MISFSGLGKQGRTGNILFQIAAMFGLAEKYGVECRLAYWPDAYYFPNLKWNTKIPVNAKQVQEPAFHFTPDFFDTLDLTKDIDFSGYFQTEKYFPSNAKELFSFHPDLVESCKEHLKTVYEKTTIAIHIRRGDYVDNPNYFSLSPNYYHIALETHFPDWRGCNLLFFSDDIDYCKLHFSCLQNAYFSENLTDVADLCCMSLCDHFIIANSSFSWWGAWLGESEDTKIVRPSQHFSGKLKAHQIRDLYPKRWVSMDCKECKIDIPDLTITIPVSFDHSDRKENLELCIVYLLTKFNVKIVVGEQGGNAFEYLSKYCEYRHFDLEVFHRTKMLNEMAASATTEFVANYDCDVFLSPIQILEAMHRLRQGDDICYPYDGDFLHVERNGNFHTLADSLDLGVFAKLKTRATRNSKGGAVFVNKKRFFDAGGENERMVNHAPEDLERWERFTKLGLKVSRVKGSIFHMEHWRGVNSHTEGHRHSKENQTEFTKIKSLGQQQLKEYIATWKKYL